MYLQIIARNTNKIGIRMQKYRVSKYDHYKKYLYYYIGIK